jgi:hypothetical protein
MSARSVDRSRPVTSTQRPARLDFAAINGAAIRALPALLRRWVPDGMIRGCEYVARNPMRADRRAGSFSINLRTGCWADFAIADARGGDVISLVAYLAGCSQFDAARKLAAILGVVP